MRILFTGGAGKAGKHAVAHLLSQGHRVLNVDRVPLDMDGVENRISDITDAGHMSFTGMCDLLENTPASSLSEAMAGFFAQIQPFGCTDEFMSPEETQRITALFAVDFFHSTLIPDFKTHLS